MNSDTTIKLVSLALDAALMRQTAIANNIANSNSDGYQTMEVNFEQQMEQLDNNSHEKDLSTIAPFYQPGTQHSAIEEQMALNVQNMTHYRALIKGLNHKIAIMNIALQGTNS